MVFKHGLIPLEVHSWLTANLATSLSRERGQEEEIQALSWFYGLVHDAGVLSLQPRYFDHTKVSEDELDLLVRLIEERYGVSIKPLIESSHLVAFAHQHALTHIEGRKGRRRLRENFGDEVAENVLYADWISTGREKLGFQKNVLPIFRSYTTEYIFNTPYRRHNIACFLEHTTRLNKFKDLINSRAEKIRDELGVPRYDPIVTESTWAIEYYLSNRDSAEIRKRFKEWLHSREAEGTITSETRRGPVTIRTTHNRSSISRRCVLCGRPGRFYKGIRDSKEVRERKKALKEQGVEGPEATIHMGRGDVRRVLGFEIDTWRGEFDGKKVRFQDKRRGICDECATALNNNQPILEGLLIYIPRGGAVYEYYTDTIYRRKLRRWEEWSEKGLCSPDPRFFDLDYWKKTPDYSRSLGGLDERRARYERALQIYSDNIEEFSAKVHGVFASVEPSPVVFQKLVESRITLAPMSYGCIKPSGSEKVVVNGFSFDRDVAACVLKLISNGVKLNPSLGIAENLSIIGKRVEGLSTRDLDLIMSDYERVVEALSV